MCNCVANLNIQLEKQKLNTRISVLKTDSGDVTALCTESVKENSRPLRFFALYCPFCGEKTSDMIDTPAYTRITEFLEGLKRDIYTSQPSQ